MYNGDIMTKLKDFQKVRVKATKDIYYTYHHWPRETIDGVEFIGVVKNQPSHNTQIVHKLRKDSVEYIK
jgi:uncharacterized protein YegJ (DUF2314 family)